jgi:hypothetical protein
MRSRLVPLLVVVAFGACGKEIGDACVIAQDCSPNGDRICIDVVQTSAGTTEGYCTIRGCDYSTCPDEAVCVRFFTGSFSNKPCDFDPAHPDDPQNPKPLCSLDEVCALNGYCVARSSEIRYCMRTCGSDGDCRDGYECRDLEKMKADGGEPVLAPGVVVDADAPKFCAAAPASP